MFVYQYFFDQEQLKKTKRNCKIITSNIFRNMPTVNYLAINVFIIITTLLLNALVSIFWFFIL